MLCKWGRLVCFVFLLSSQAFASIEQIVLSECFISSPPVRKVPAPGPETSCYTDSVGNYCGRLSVSYSYRRKQDVLIIVTESYGKAYEKVVEKSLPETETYTVNENEYAHRVADRAFQFFQNRFEELQRNACQ